MDGRSLFAIVAVLVLFSGCAMPWEEPAVVEEQGEDGGDTPPIRQVDKTVAIVDDSAKEPEPEPEPEVEEVEEIVGEPAGANETVASVLVEFQPPEMLLDCRGECTRHRVHHDETGIVVGSINQSRLIVGKEKEYFLIYPSGCGEMVGADRDNLTIDGTTYGFDYPFGGDWSKYATFEGDGGKNFSLHEGEMERVDEGTVFVWRIVPGGTGCDAWLEVSIFEDYAILEEWMNGVVLGLEEKDENIWVNYLMYPEGTLD